MPQRKTSTPSPRVRRRANHSQANGQDNPAGQVRPRQRTRLGSSANPALSGQSNERALGPRPSARAPFDPSVEWRQVSDLTPHPRNARTHSRKQIAKIAASIKQFGFTNPVLTDADSLIIAGHGRVDAARLLGMEQVPTIRLDHLSEAQLRAYVITDNRLAEIAGWDRDTLAIELQFLSEIEVDFDVEITGFETAEIDLMIECPDRAATDEADQVPVPRDDQLPITRPGDLWLLGRHRLLCGDALEKASYERLLDGDVARMVFTDPPYNVPIDGHVSGLGRTKHREFAMGTGEMSSEAFQAFLGRVLGNHADACLDGALLYVCMDWRHLLELLQAGQSKELSLINLCVWNKTNGGMGSFYRSKHELVPIFKKGAAPHINTIELGSHGRYRTNVWDYAGINAFGANRLDALAMHPTVKPVALVSDAIKDCTRRGDLVLDGFAGSGTTLIATEKTGRTQFGIELDPRYVDTAVRRWERLTGEKAVHAEDQITMDEVAEARGLAEVLQTTDLETTEHDASKETSNDE